MRGFMVSCSYAVALLAGCVPASSADGSTLGSGTGDTAGTGDDTTSSDESESESESDTGPVADLPGPSASVVGFVTDELGAPISALPITLCGEICQVGMTDAAGRFEVLNVNAGIKVLEPALVPIGDDLEAAVKSWTRFFDFVEVIEGEQIVIDEPFVMLRVDNTVGPLTGPQTLTPLPELSVNFNADAIAEAGALPVGVDAVWLGARAVPVELWPSGGLEGWTIVAAWSLAVWNLEAPNAFAVQASLPDALPAAAEVAFLVADYNYGFANGKFFEEPAQLSPDGLTLSTPVGDGLDRATLWLAVTRP